MNQFALGFAVPFFVFAGLYLASGCRASLLWLILAPVLMFLSGIWAVIPDIPRFIGRYDLYNRLARDPRIDIFYCHYTIDRFEGLSPIYSVLVPLMLAVCLMAAWRELKLAEDRSE